MSRQIFQSHPPILVTDYEIPIKQHETSQLGITFDLRQTLPP